MTSYWDWAIEVHGRPGVDDALTGLQDTHGQCVAYLLWAAWAVDGRRALPPEILMQGAALARHWEGAALRERVRDIEFAAERLLMETLEGLAPEPDAGALDLADALVAASVAWSRTVPEAELRELATRIG